MRDHGGDVQKSVPSWWRAMELGKVGVIADQTSLLGLGPLLDFDMVSERF